MPMMKVGRLFMRRGWWAGGSSWCFSCLFEGPRLFFRGWSHYAVRSCLGIWLSWLRTTFPIKPSCLLAIWLRSEGIPQKKRRTVSFLMCSSFTRFILIPKIFRRLLWKKTSIFLNRDSRIAHLSHPHNRSLSGIAQKIRYLLRVSTAWSIQNSRRDTIITDACPNQCSMSKLSRRE